MPRNRMLLLSLVAFTVLLGWPSLELPPGRDQAIFSVVGRTITGGGMPYLDAFDFKPPGIHLWYALADLLGGWMALRWLDVASVLATVIGLFTLLRRRSLVSATVAGATYAVCMLATLRYWDLAQPEGLIALCTVWGLILFWRSTVSPWTALVAGVLFGAAVWMKYTAILLLPLCFLVVDRREWRVRSALYLVTGVAVSIVVVAGWLVVGGAWGPFREIQTDYLPGYSRLLLAGGFGVAAKASLRIVTDFFVSRPLWLLPVVLGIPLIVWKGRRPRWWVPIAGLVLAVAGIIPQGKFFHYHWLTCLPFLAWLAGDAAAAMWTTNGRRAMVVAVLSIAAGVSVAPVWGEKIASVRAATGAISADEFVRNPAFGRYGVGDHAFSATQAASHALAELTEADESVLVWGFEPWLYIGADRAPASRFIYNVAFLSPWCPPGWRRELMDGLRRDPPAVIVVVAYDALPWVTGVPIDSRAGLTAVPGLPEFLNSRYRLAGREEHFTFFGLIK